MWPHWQNDRIFCWLTWWLSGKRGNKPSRKTSPCDMLHLPYGPLLSWLHQHRQTNNTYKCEMCRFHNSIPVGVIVTSFKTELVRFGNETERGCTCDSRRLDALTPQALHFRVKTKKTTNQLKSWKKKEKKSQASERTTPEQSSYILASTRACVASVAGLLELPGRRAWASRASHCHVTAPLPHRIKKYHKTRKKEKIFLKAAFLHPHSVSQMHSNLGKRGRRNRIFSGVANASTVPSSRQTEQACGAAVRP